MEILKLATDWAKDEVFSSRFFILFGILFLLAAIGFWQLGKTDVAKAYQFPTLIAGLLILAVGLGIYFTNKSRVTSFETAYKADPAAFVQAEIERSEKTIAEFRTIVFKVVPLIIIAAALLLIFFSSPLWRAISVTTIAMMAVILLVDSNANARIKTYHDQLVQYVEGAQALDPK
ncbi:MAG: hypothetical protein AAGA85_14905 [Bacteroidota bacterium]